MRKHRIFPLIAMLLVICMGFSACSPNGPSEDTASGEDTLAFGKVRVMLTASDGVTILPQAVQDINMGGNAVYTLQFAENYAFVSADAGEFDPETNTLTIKDVMKSTMITVLAEKMAFDTSKEVFFYMRGSTEKDTASVTVGSKVKLGTMITVSAGNTSKHFAGWVLGENGEIVSKERTYTFQLTPEMLIDDALDIRPRYTAVNQYSYDANGGVINRGTVNAKGNDMSTVVINGTRANITLSPKYLEKLTCGTAFWNDGTFTREGYVLKEYNTKPDGTGDTILPGDKFYQVNPDGGDFVLYCIWQEAKASDFTYDPYTMALPNGVRASHVPEWKTEGLIITGYTGNADFVAIPESIDGKPVIAIQKGAIKNKSFKTLYLSRNLQEVQDGAVVGCSSMTRLYFPGGIYDMGDDAFDDSTYSKWREFYVYSNIAPRYANNENGAYGSIKLSRILASQDQNRVIAIAGSSALQGIGSEYLEALLDSEYIVVNFGTTRTTHGSLYLEAMQNFAHEGDIVFFAPENSIYMMGDTTLYWKTIRDMESIFQLFRYVDISEYDEVFNAFRDQNQNYVYKRAATAPEDCAKVSSLNTYGDDVRKNKNGYVNSSSTAFIEAYNISLNNRFKSVDEGDWQKAGFQNDFNHDSYWVSIDESPYKDQMNRVIDLVKKTGAGVYFGFAPVDARNLFDEAKTIPWLDAYDQMILDTFTFDGIIGSSKNHIFAHEYFYDCAFHTNNYGRTWHTYNLYLGLCEILDKKVEYDNGDLGTKFDQCLFEKDSAGGVLKEPKYKVDFLG